MRKGDTVGELTLLHSHIIERAGRRLWACRCSCGKTCTVRQDSLQSGATRSCGHLQIEYARTGDGHRIHGATGTPMWQVWKNMHRRCSDMNSKDYVNYGGRGISVSEEWSDFNTFLSDMGERPSDEHSLERRNNERGYCRDNCYWATKTEQNRNTRRTHWVALGDEHVSLAEAAERTGVNYGTLKSRIRRGWSDSQALVGR